MFLFVVAPAIIIARLISPLRRVGSGPGRTGEFIAPDQLPLCAGRDDSAEQHGNRRKQEKYTFSDCFQATHHLSFIRRYKPRPRGIWGERALVAIEGTSRPRDSIPSPHVRSSGF